MALKRIIKDTAIKIRYKLLYAVIQMCQVVIVLVYEVKVFFAVLEVIRYTLDSTFLCVRVQRHKANIFQGDVNVSFGIISCYIGNFVLQSHYLK